MPEAQHVPGVGSLAYFSETGNGAATEMDLSFLRARDWPRLISYEVDSDQRNQVGGADHRLLVAWLFLYAAVEEAPSQEPQGCESDDPPEEMALSRVRSRPAREIWTQPQTLPRSGPSGVEAGGDTITATGGLCGVGR